MNNSLGLFCRGSLHLVNTLGRHPRITVTCDAFGPGFPVIDISMSTTGYGHTNVSPTRMLDALNNCYNIVCTSGFGLFSGICHIVVRTSPRFHLSRRSLGGVFMHIGKRVTPVDRFVDVGGDVNPRIVGHFGLFRSVRFDIGPTPNCSANSIVGTVSRMFSRIVPGHCRCRCNNVSHRRTRAAGSGNATCVCVFYIMLVFLVLTYLCRDFLMPVTMVLSIPFNLVNSFLFTG